MQDRFAVDMLHGQDVSRSRWGALRTKEFHVSHYLDHTPPARPASACSKCC